MIELIYFNIHGGVRGLLHRLLLKYGDVEFKDTQVDFFTEWTDFKPSSYTILIFIQNAELQNNWNKIFTFWNYFQRPYWVVCQWYG